MVECANELAFVSDNATKNRQAEKRQLCFEVKTESHDINNLPLLCHHTGCPRPFTSKEMLLSLSILKLHKNP